MSSVLNCQVVSMEHSLFSGEATFVSVPALAGSMGFYPKHSPVLATLGTGLIKVVTETEAEPVKIAVRGGYVENDGEYLTILADYAEKISDLDIEALEERVKALQKQLDDTPEVYASRIKLTTQNLEWYKKLLAYAQDDEE